MKVADTYQTTVYIIFVALLASFEINVRTEDNIKSVIRQTRRYLFRSARLANIDDTSWLQNSGKIGVGYNSMVGSPVCYSGQCEMEGFRQPLLKLNMKTAEGSCSSKLVPRFVHLECLSPTQLVVHTQYISTFNQLKESTKRGIVFTANADIFNNNSFVYSHSLEIRSMIDTIAQSNATIYFTQATISSMRLSAFVPLLELSDQFRYVIENMPCCDESDELKQYIREFIIDYFGLLYVKELLLGGIIQQKITVSEENRKQLYENGFTMFDQKEMQTAASYIFATSAKLKHNEQLDPIKLNAFRKFSQQSDLIILGGKPNAQSVEEWSKTVISNPAIVKFTVAPLTDLLKTRHFPNDNNLAAKIRLIERVQHKYITKPAFCYNDCSQHGTCMHTNYFGFGRCQCSAEWTGIDCSVAALSLRDQIPLYRYCFKGVHFYTTNENEIGTVTPGSTGRFGYVYEGIACYLLQSRKTNTVPFYRYGAGVYSHFYTTNWTDVGTHTLGATINGWTMEGIIGYVYMTRQPGTCPLYQYYRPSQHFYTVNPCEIGVVKPGLVGSHNFQLQGIAAYVITSFPCETIVC